MPTLAGLLQLSMKPRVFRACEWSQMVDAYAGVRLADMVQDVILGDGAAFYLPRRDMNSRRSGASRSTVDLAVTALHRVAGPDPALAGFVDSGEQPFR